MLDPLSLNLETAVHTRPRPSHPPRKLLTPVPGSPDDYTMEADYSALSQFMECPRKSENYLVRGREASRDQSALHFGTLFHKLEEHRLVNGLTEPVIAKQKEMIAEYTLSNPVAPTDHRTGDRMLDVIKKYNDIYRNDGLDKKVFMFEGAPFVERAFKIPLMTIKIDGLVPYRYSQLVKGPLDENILKSEKELGWNFFRINNLHLIYTGRIDAVEEEASNLIVIDNKTSSRGGPEFVEAFRLSMQTRGYCWAVWKITDRMPISLLMNAVIVRPLTKTGTGTEFNRHTYFYSKESLLEWEQNMKATAEDFVAALVRGYFPQHARSFKSPCSMCDYSNNCALPPEQRLADLASDQFRDVTWNPIHE